MNLWVRLRAALDAGVHQRVTRLGLLFTLTCLLVALAAFSSANNLLFLILAAMLATLMVSGLISRLSLAGLAMDLLLPDHISARRKTPGKVVVQNDKRWMASFSIHLAGQGQSAIPAPLYFPVIPGGARMEQPVDFYFERRGSYQENSFRVSTRFPFGFAERRVSLVLRREVIIYPCLDPQPGFEDLFDSLHGEIESHRRGQGTDFYRIRPYEALESARHVDWKATAHTGALQVREFAKDQEQSVLFALDLNVDARHLAWFENSVECCAYLLWRLAPRGIRLGLRTQTADLQLPRDGDVYTILKYLATVKPSPGKLAPAFEERSAYHVVFSAAPEPLLEQAWELNGRGVRILGPDAVPGLASSGPTLAPSPGNSQDRAG